MKRTVSNNTKGTKEEVKMIRALHRYIRCWRISKARSLIRNLSKKKRRRLTRGYQEFGLKPAIFVAIEKRDTELVKLLVNECHADIEEQLFDERMSPLQFAYVKKNYFALDFLLKSGADPTTLVKDRKCVFHPRWIKWVSSKTLQILADHGADFNTPDEHGFTCLMSTVRSSEYLLDFERWELCRLLLNIGVDVNLANDSGNTALHLAVEEGYPYLVKLFLQNGAELYCTNNDGFDPLHLACINRLEEIVDLLLETVEDATRRFESYQLLGTYFGEDKKAMSAWRKAVKLYSEIPNRPSPVKLNTPFGIAVEATSVSDLDALSLNRDLFFMQSVVINRKIFGPTHAMFLRSVRSSATIFYDLKLFDKWMQMLTYLLVHTSSLTFSERCSHVERIVKDSFEVDELNESKAPLNFTSVSEFLEVVVQILQNCTKLTWNKDLVEFFSQFTLVNFESSHRFEYQRFVCLAVKFIGQWCERTVLIDALSSWIPYYLHAPFLTGVTALLECGADVNERDQNNNSVVHFLLERRTYIKTDFLKQIAAKFVEYGVHPDARNSKGMTTSECLQQMGMRVTPPINLMCIAARGIRRHNITVRGVLPPFLIDFVEMH